jgi:DNA-binding NarL/FixJ family response regulator
VSFAAAAPLLERLAAVGPGGAPGLLLVDLGARDDQGFVLLERLSSVPAPPPTLAFFSHVDDAARRRAIGLGATKVVPRSALVARFATLVRETAAASP